MASDSPRATLRSSPSSKGSEFGSAYPRYALGLLVVVYVFNFVDRSILSILLESIKQEFHFSDTQLGFLTGIAFALFYAVMGIPIARWADHGTRKTIGKSSSSLLIGARGKKYPFRGKIDEVRMYGRLLTQKEITFLAQRRPAQQPSH